MKLKDILSKKSNDYSKSQKAFFEKFKKNFNNGKINKKFSEAISIIIPTLNPEYLNKTLLSINLQNYDLNKVEVIIIFDGIDFKMRKKFNFNIVKVYLKTNKGAAFARNVGLAKSKNKYVLFLDSDIILPKNFLSNHVARHLISNNLVTMSFRKKVNPYSKKLLNKNILLGIKNIDLSNVDDFRVRKNFNSLYNFKSKKNVFLLKETNYFKDFGKGKQIKLWTLPMVVNAHNLMILKRNAIKIGGFNKQFKLTQWDDIEFGAKAIASGLKAVPITCCNVISIKDKPKYNKKKYFNKNEKIYLNQLEKEFNLVNQKKFLEEYGCV